MRFQSYCCHVVIHCHSAKNLGKGTGHLPKAGPDYIYRRLAQTSSVTLVKLYSSSLPPRPSHCLSRSFKLMEWSWRGTWVLRSHLAWLTDYMEYPNPARVKSSTGKAQPQPLLMRHWRIHPFRRGLHSNFKTASIIQTCALGT